MTHHVFQISTFFFIATILPWYESHTLHMSFHFLIIDLTLHDTRQTQCSDAFLSQRFLNVLLIYHDRYCCLECTESRRSNTWLKQEEALSRTFLLLLSNDQVRSALAATMAPGQSFV